MAAIGTPLEFELNGGKVTIDSFDPTVTLIEVIRRHAGLTGTKLGCGEGGCGACAVLLTETHPVTGKTTTRSVNSCLRPAASVHGAQVTTVEGLGTSTDKDGVHPIMNRIAKLNATQCGFCTPGFVVSAFAALKTASQKGVDATMEQMTRSMDGNVCRCTGYRPLIDTFASLAADSNVQDHIHGSGLVAACPSRDPTADMPPPAKTAGGALFAGSGVTWKSASTLKEALTLVSTEPAARFVVGNTHVGVYKDRSEATLVNIAAVPELRGVTVDAKGVTIGAVEPIADFLDALDSAIATHGAAAATLDALRSLTRRVANVHVRNGGSVGGNIAMARDLNFLSDLATALLGANAVVSSAVLVGDTVTTKEEPMAAFLSSPALPPNAAQAITSIHVPFAPAGTVAVTHKTSLRLVNAVSLVNAAFSANVDPSSGRVTNTIIAIGGIAPRALRCSAAEAALNAAGRTFDSQAIEDALKADLTAAGALDGAQAKKEDLPALIAMANGMLYKFRLSLCASAPAIAAPPRSELAEPRPTTIEASQTYKRPDGATKALPGHAIGKVGGELQASGEALYIDDVPNVAGTTYATFVQSTVARGKLEALDVSAALASPGVIRVLTAEDVPGSNIVGVFGTPETLFVPIGGNVDFYSQALGLVVADTLRHAEKAAKLVKATITATDPPVFTIDGAKKAGRVISPMANVVKKGDPAAAIEGCATKITGRCTSGQQKHFYMETQATYAIPGEGGSIKLHTANQYPGGTHALVAKTLKLPQHKVTLTQRRAGGGFGGKVLRHIPTAAACAVASHVLQKPVKMHLNRNVDMNSVGGRHDIEADYSVGVDADGVIKGLSCDVVINGGYIPEAAMFVTSALSSSLDQGYYIENFECKTTPCTTNTPIRTAMRGPGEIQASFVMENIIEHIAHVTGIDAMSIRERNMFKDDDETKLVTPNGVQMTHFTLPRIWSGLKQEANWDALVDQVKAFNDAHRFRKRGLAMTPVRYKVSAGFTAALVNAYHDGSIMIAHGGCDIGQGLQVKVAQAAASALVKLDDSDEFDTDLIGFIETDTRFVPNMTFTGGSTQSEQSCASVRKACDELVARLTPVRKKLLEAGKPAGWVECCAAATAMGAKVDLSSQCSHDMGLPYFNYGAGLSIVEVDVLTGEIHIIRSDIHYDCGVSLNPAVDIGQAEGAFITGMGFYLREHCKVDEETGRLISNGTWDYKVPFPIDIPRTFNVKLIDNPDFDKGFASSKASGEPPLVLATSIHAAMRQAIHAARAEVDQKEWVNLHAPCGPMQVLPLLSK